MSEILKDLLLSLNTSIGCIRVVKVRHYVMRRRINMTDTQVRYAQNVENIRHNYAMEEENRRHNVATEAAAQQQMAETARANRASEANARYAAEQSFLGNAVKAEASKYSADQSRAQNRAKIVADAAQREADRKLQELLQTKQQGFTAEENQKNRDLSQYVEDQKATISKDANDIKREANELTSVKNDRDWEFTQHKMEQDLKDYSLKMNEYKLGVKKFAHQKNMDAINATITAIDEARKVADNTLSHLEKISDWRTAQSQNRINNIINMVRALGGINNG